MTARTSIQLPAAMTLTVVGSMSDASQVARNDDNTIGAYVAPGATAVLGPYPYPTIFTLTGDATYSVSNAPQYEVDIVTADYTVAASDTTKLLRVSSSSAVVITLPANLPYGYIVTVLREGTGSVTFAAGSGATINASTTTRTIASQYDTVAATVYDNSTGAAALWLLSGSLG